MFARKEARARLANSARSVASSRAAVRSLDLFLEFFGRTPQRLFGPLAFGDVEGDALQKQRPAVFVADDSGFAMNPNLAIVAGNEAVFGTEADARGTGAGEFRSPPLAIVGMQLPIPQERIAQPFFLGESEHRFDVRADVDFVFVQVRRPATP